MNPFARLEAACAAVVERAFAVAFPSALQPVQIARKLVAAFEGYDDGGRRNGVRFVVRLAPSDCARFEADRVYLEGQWRAMLARLAERSGRPQRRPEVRIVATPAVAAGTAGVDVEALEAPLGLVLRVRRGIPPEAGVSLAGSVVVGRGNECQLVLADPRVSRRHLAIEADGEDFRFVDLGSANGTRLNGTPVREGSLQCGDVLGIGDSELIVEAAAP